MRRKKMRVEGMPKLLMVSKSNTWSSMLTVGMIQAMKKPAQKSGFLKRLLAGFSTLSTIAVGTTAKG